MISSASSEGYTLEILAEITGLTTQTIVLYQEHGLIPSPYDDETIRALRRVEHLRETCEMNLAGLKLMKELLDEMERLRTELRARR